MHADARVDRAADPRRARGPGSGRPRWYVLLLAAVGVTAAVLAGIAAVTSSATRDTASVSGSPTPDAASGTPSPSRATNVDGRVQATAADVDRALRFVHHADTERLLTISIDGSFGSVTNLPADVMPDFGAADRVRWADKLGEYYGVDLWLTGLEVAQPAPAELCLVIRLATGTVRARCAARPLWEIGALFVPVAAGELTDDERPDGMAISESIAFWWTDDDAVLVMRGPRPPER